MRRIAALLGKVPAGIRLLDVGCSRGHFVAAAVAAGFAGEGVEPAPQIAAAARATGLTVHPGLLDEQRFPAASFDAVTLFEVIEHLRKPRTLLAECHRILKPRGVLVLSTGNTASWTVAAMGARWDYFHLAKDGGHVSFFSPVSVKRLATACGYGLERMETSRVRFHEKTDAPPWRYALGKAAAELLSFPARLLGKGHDLVAYLRAT